MAIQSLPSRFNTCPKIKLARFPTRIHGKMRNLILLVIKLTLRSRLVISHPINSSRQDSFQADEPNSKQHNGRLTLSNTRYLRFSPTEPEQGEPQTRARPQNQTGQVYRLRTLRLGVPRNGKTEQENRHYETGSVHSLWSLWSHLSVGCDCGPLG